jgi:RNA polymerase sigma factor (sigma-70 family)
MSDREIWQDILDGNSEAWGQLVNRYQALIYTVCIRCGLSLADAADCFQYTWLTLYQNRHKIKNPSRLSAWLVTTAKREALRLRRISDKERIDSGQLIMSDTSPLPDEELERLEFQAQLEVSLKELSPRCQRILYAFFFESEDKSYKDIAKMLNIPFNTLGPLRNRCLKRLKKILLKNDFAVARKNESDPL